jgi:hypothetical protein
MKLKIFTHKEFSAPIYDIRILKSKISDFSFDSTGD